MTDVLQQPRNFLIYLGLALITAAVYGPVLHFGFISLDDEPYIAQNPHLRGEITLHQLIWALTTPLDQWMPVTWLARILEYRLVGLNAGLHHLVNVLLHVVNTLLLFNVLNRMTAARWRSALVAALFALHPLHVEAVAWVTGLKDVLSMCFEMLTIWTYVRYVEQFTVHGSRTRVFYTVTLLFFALALMSKPMAVTLPFVLLLLDYWPLGRTRWAQSAIGDRVKVPPSQLFREKLPLFAMTAASCVMTYWARRSLGTVTSLESLPLGPRITRALLSYVGYLGKAFWPTKLAVFYPLDASLSWAGAIVACVGLAGVTVAVIRRARREPWLATGWFWYFGTLVPVIGLVQVGVVQAMADRYTYVPFIGLFIMLCWSVPSRALERRFPKVAVGAAAVTSLTVCTLLTRGYLGYWKDTETLFRHALNVTRDNWVAHNNLGSALLAQGRVQEAIAHWEQSLRLKPDCVEAHSNLGFALSLMGRLREAAWHYEQAAGIKPENAEARDNLGNALLRLGKVQEAIRQYEQALRLKPTYAEPHYDLGIALQQMGRVQEAMKHYERAVQLNPDFAEAHNNLGIALKDVGKVPEAIEHYEEALRIKPDYAEAHYNWGIALVQLGRIQEAVRHWELALQIQPDYPEAHYNLGVALEQAGRVQEAIGHYEQALRIRPGMAKARDRLAQLRFAQ